MNIKFGFLRSAVFAVLFFSVLQVSLWAQQPAELQPAELLKQADAAWKEKSYARAVELYSKVLESKSASDLDEVEFRIAVSLGKTEKWDEAISQGEALLEKTEWKARVLYWLGRLYTEVPPLAWRVNGKLYRGADYPKIEGAEQPQRVHLQQEDAQKTLEYFEKAKLAAPAERKLATRAPAHFLTSREEIDLNFDLAAFLPGLKLQEFISELDKADREKRQLSEKVELSEPYNLDWNLPTKVLYLYDEIPRLDSAKDKHKTALSLLAKGMFIRSYRQRLDSWASRYDAEQQKQIKRKYPFNHLEPIPVLQQVIDRHSKDEIAPQTQILIAQIHQQENDQVKALMAYELLLKKFPKSKWISDARSHIQQIKKKELHFDTMGPQTPGKNAKIAVRTRNLKELRFSAYRVKLEKYLQEEKRAGSPRSFFQSFQNNFGELAKLQKELGTPTASWKVKTQDKSNYLAVLETIDVPLKELGAYILIAEQGNLRFGGVLIISDLALLVKTDRDNTFAYVADAQSGKPLSNAQVTIKEQYHQDNIQKISIAEGKSSQQGFFDKKLTRGKGIYSNSVSAFAWTGDRYAMTGQGYAAYYGGWSYGDNRDELKVYSETDRSVYRPGQKVYFREIVTRRVGGGDQTPARDMDIRVQIHNPKGEVIHTEELTTSEFGTVSGEFHLPEETPLGEYFINVQATEKTRAQLAAGGGNRFRVEEYKRPEFQINIDAPSEAVRPGGSVDAQVNVKYYFGAPVPNAKVKYTVRKSTWWANYRFPRPFDWLWSYWGEGDYNTGRRNIGGEGSGEIVEEGETTTDAEGNAKITFQTKPLEENEPAPSVWWRYYSNPLYTIEVEATDASRRTIEGQGSVRVADQQYFAFLDVQKGFYQSGDSVQVELVTQDANSKPLSTTGKMVVYKLLPGDKEENVFEEEVKTDARGRVFWVWKSSEEGQFRIAYEATDDWGKTIKASANVWVSGPNMRTTTFRQKGVTVVLEDRYYEEGDTAKVLLVADQPDTAVLFTQEAGGELLKRELVHIEGKSKTVSIPIKKEHVPNFVLGAAAIKDFEVYQTLQEVFVPPTRQLIDISVTGDKSEYKPGETGKFTIKAKDWKGNPARAEVSLAMVDASLFYIQKSYAPDIRTFYYGERRANSTNLSSHRNGQAQGRLEDRTKYFKYDQHNWELPDGFGMLNLMPGGGWYGIYPRFRQMGPRILHRTGTASYVDADSAGPTGLAGPAGSPPSVVAAKESLQMEESAGDMRSGALAEAEVRSNFEETAFWSPAVVTENGEAQVEITFPDSLTQWHATARGLTPTTQVGAGEMDVETKKDILVRMQAPRFFTERDQVVLSANVHNYLQTDKRIKVGLKLGSELQLNRTKIVRDSVGVNLESEEGWIDVKANSETRVNWTVDVVRDGTTELQMTAQSDEESDAVKMNFPVMVHGVQRLTSQSGTMREGDSVTKQTIKINLPEERKFGTSSLNVQLNPSLAATMMDALPYLMDYPYGCVEQTMSRFLPSVIVQKTLVDSGIDLKTLQVRAKTYESQAQDAPIGERVRNSGYSYPKGMPNSRDLTQMASRLWTPSAHKNPIYDQELLDKMVRDGLNRLYRMQRPDGGWGWWQGSLSSDQYMSAYVVYGLATTRLAGVTVRDDVLNRGYAYLEKQMKEVDNIHLLTWISFALSQRGKLSPAAGKTVSGRLFEQRERLTSYSKSLLALTLWNMNEKEKAKVLVRNLENSARIDEENGTARWTRAREYWYWWNDDVETNAWALRAFMQIDPDNRLAPMLMKWLTQQTRSNHWRSTKATAAAVYALADYVRVNKELGVDYTLRVNLNGKLAKTYRVNAENALVFDNRFITGELFLEDGENVLTIEKIGKGNLYWSATTEYFSLEEPIRAAGNEMAINRRYFKLTRKPAKEKENADETETVKDGSASPRSIVRPYLPRPIPVPPREPEYSRTELRDGDQLQSGDLIEVELIIDAHNDYEYLVFEDMKAAGLEPVELRSGYARSDGLSSNVELRDEKVVLFVDRLPQGTRVLRYRMRAEIPGKFHILPTNGYAMYAPEVRAISDELRVNIRD